MSNAPRMPLERASAAATLLLEQWRMNTPDVMVAGSVRRKAALVGDLDIVAPLPPRADGPDRLFDAIEATLIQDGGLFPSEGTPFVHPIQGVKPHFKEARVVADLSGVIPGREKDKFEVPVQICRYTPNNRGWMELMKTGPVEFNVWFLARWKIRFEIVPKAAAGNPEGNALIHNHLVDRYGLVVAVEAEGACFQKLGIPFVHPWDRERHPGVARAADARNREELMR